MTKQNNTNGVNKIIPDNVIKKIIPMIKQINNKSVNTIILTV